MVEREEKEGNVEHAGQKPEMTIFLNSRRLIAVLNIQSFNIFSIPIKYTKKGTCVHGISDFYEYNYFLEFYFNFHEIPIGNTQL